MMNITNDALVDINGTDYSKFIGAFSKLILMVLFYRNLSRFVYYTM